MELNTLKDFIEQVKEIIINDNDAIYLCDLSNLDHDLIKRVQQILTRYKIYVVDEDYNNNYIDNIIELVSLCRKEIIKIYIELEI